MSEHDRSKERLSRKEIFQITAFLNMKHLIMVLLYHHFNAGDSDEE